MSKNLTIGYALSSSSADDTLILEQVPWENYIAKVTKGAIAQYLKFLLYQYDEPVASIDCGLDGDTWTGVIRAYPLVPSLKYNIGVSHGTVGSGTAYWIEHEEFVNFKIADSAKLKYFSQELISAEFVGSAYDSEGGIVPNPEIVVSGNILRLSEKVFVTVKVKYKVYMVQHSVTIPKRELAEENKYTSVIFAHFDGGVVWEELEPPTDADIQDKCGWGTVSQEFLDEPECRPVGTLADVVQNFDYCSGEMISESYEEYDDRDPIC